MEFITAGTHVPSVQGASNDKAKCNYISVDIANVVMGHLGYVMREKQIVKFVTLALIVSLTISSIINISEKSFQYHDSASSYLVSVGFAVSFSLTVYIVMIAQTDTTRRAAIVSAAVFGIVSAWIQTSVYLDSGASFGVALSYGVGVPGFEAALAILHALLSHEDDMTPAVIEEVSPVTRQIVTDKIEPVVKGVSVTLSERRSRLSQIMTSVTVNTDKVTEWAKEFGTSERTILRDIAALRPTGGD